VFCKLIVEFNYIIIHLNIVVPLIYGNKLPKKAKHANCDM